MAAALLAALGGSDVSALNIEKILGSVGVEADSDSVATVVNQLKGKTVDQVIAEGLGKLASMPAGGGAAPAAGGAAAAAPAAAAEEKKRRRKKNLKKRKMMTWDSVFSTRT